MKLVALLLLGVHLSYAARHSMQYIYTAVSGINDFPEFTAVGLVDDVQVNYFDSNIMKVVPKTDWMRQNVEADYWDRNTQIAVGEHQVYKSNIQILKERFNQTAGMHTIQRMYGCEWDDETDTINGLYQDGYDGEDLVTLDYKELRYIASVPQGVMSAEKWNNEIGNLENWKNYLGIICIEWLKKYLQYGKSSLEKIESPQVSLLQKDPSSPVTCHATGFYPSGVTISWQRNGQDHYENVDLGELLSNEDGTFQKMSTLNITPDEWKKNQYSCVVEHKRKTINKIMTEQEIISNYETPIPIGIIVGVVAAVVLLVAIGVIGYMVYKRRGKSGFVPANTSDGGSNNSSQGATA